jgi:hypothetical protein
MTQYDLAAPARVCAATGRTLPPGERIVSVLTDDGGKLVRQDFSADGWPGPPPNAVAHWQGKVPTATAPKRPAVNEPLLFDCFDHLAGQTEPNKVHFRYVVALLLMRRKRLKFEDVKRTADGGEVLVLRDTRGGKRVEVRDPRLSEDEIEGVQAQVFQVLGWE